VPAAPSVAIGMLQLAGVQKQARKRWREHDLEPIGLHEARHTAATWLDHAGVSPKVVSQLMGHKTPEYQPGAASITLRRYTHTLPGEIERARDLLDAFLAERAREEAGHGPLSHLVGRLDHPPIDELCPHTGNKSSMAPIKLPT
jgi:hypothetical protein